MTQNASKLARTGLQYSLGLVLSYESCGLLFSSASAHIPLPHVLLKAIAAVELLGAILFLIPPAVLFGGRLLLATFVVAALVHILHGQPDVGYLVIYAMAVLTITTERG
jgi:uncharacterized membrane protein YphA (DoxX/SURF4 family)